MFYLEELENDKFVIKEMDSNVDTLLTKFWNRVIQAKDHGFDIDIKVVDNNNKVVDYYCYVAPRERGYNGIYTSATR